MQIPRPSQAPPRRARLATILGVAAFAIAVAISTTTHVHIAGNWQGVFLLRGEDAWPLEVKDDLFLGDGSRVLAGMSFSRVRRLLSRTVAASGQPSLELDWDGESGSGVVWNHLGDGTDLVTSFSRYVDSDGKRPHGLFVGGALAEIAAGSASDQNESGMSFHDARGWHHIWCNVNEALLGESGLSYPGAWRFLGSRVLISDRDRIVLESSHEIATGGGSLTMQRFAYFRAGKPWFKLGIRIVNTEERPARFSYAYGDEPWVGEFGSAAANIGWVRREVVRVEGTIDARAERWAGILDEASNVANFIAWIGDELPDRVYFANRPGSVNLQPGAPLASNEVFIGLEWLNRELQPAQGASFLLSLGLASTHLGGGVPELPAGAGP